MPKPFIPLTIEQFAERIRSFTFTRPIRTVHMHHTFRPRKTDYRGQSTIAGMFDFHTRNNGWSDIAQHLSIAPDGTVWTGRDWNRTPASATGFSSGAFMFETIGNFDAGQETLEGAQRRAVVDVIALVQLKCGLPIESLHFHREFTNAKSCPGTGVRKADLLAEVRQARERITSGTRTLAATPNGDASASRHRSVHAVNALGPAVPPVGGATRERPFPDSELAWRGVTGGAATDREEGEVDCAAGSGPEAGRVLDPDVDVNVDVDVDVDIGQVRGSGFSPEVLAFLRRHVVNLRQGRFSGGGMFETAAADVDAMFAEHIPAALADAKARGEKLRLLVWAHGGLVDEESGLRMARAVIPWWVNHRVYPIYFVWETGLWETITQLIKGRRELEAARDFFDLTDRPIEELVRSVGGGKIWDGMKMSAQRSVESDGGARYVADALGAFCDANPGDVELHAVGHSAGSIFHSYFIPAALERNVPPFTTLSLLAPAIRVSEFDARVVPVLGNGIDALTMYTMKKDLERADNCASIYRKSLLYLIHFALEAKRGEPILGLDESIRDSEPLAKLFGLPPHPPGAHEVIWSKTPTDAGRSASRSRSHGGFDNDRATMESVLRRVLDATDADAIEPFPAEAARAFGFDAVLSPEPAPPPAEPEREPEVEPEHEPAEHAGLGAPVIASGKPRLLRALCVGINGYPGDARLSGCVNDANDWARVLRGLRFQKVDLLLDQKATRDGLRRELRNLVKAGRPGDVLVFQYSGHGTFFQDPQGDEPDRKDEAIVPVDFPQGRFILDDELFEIFDDLRDGVALTCFFDCCHSGTMSRFAVNSMLRELRESGDDEAKPRFIDPTPEMWAAYREQRTKSRAERSMGLRSSESLKTVVFSACRDDEVALERAGHGVFTTRVAPMVRKAFDDGMTNEEFQRRIVAAFGARPSQNPALDCARGAKRRPLLRLGAAAAAQPANTEGRYQDATPPTTEAVNSFLYTMEPGALEKLIHDAQNILAGR